MRQAMRQAEKASEPSDAARAHDPGDVLIRLGALIYQQSEHEDGQLASPEAGRPCSCSCSCSC